MYAKNKKLKKFLCLSAAAMLAFLMCAACLLVPAKGENGPCDTGDWAFAYISVGNDGDSSNPQGEYKTIYSASSKIFQQWKEYLTTELQTPLQSKITIIQKTELQ